MSEEYWDIYDAAGKPTGRTMKRNDWTMAPGDYHVSVIAAIRDPSGRYLISQRAADKEWGALWWEFPGGGVRAGESPLTACVREVSEETGLAIPAESLKRVLRYRRENAVERNNYFMDVYEATADFTLSDVKRQEEEVADIRLATAAEISELGKQGIFLHYDSIREIF